MRNGNSIMPNTLRYRFVKFYFLDKFLCTESLQTKNVHSGAGVIRSCK